jgi:hypothetical protein
MADRPLRRLFWRVADELHYLWALATLRILDRLAGPLPETAADRQREQDRERLRKVSPRSILKAPRQQLWAVDTVVRRPRPVHPPATYY